MKILHYFPLESYVERYSMQWSAPATGWLERNWRKISLDYRRIDAEDSLQKPRPIKTGCVLDAVKRSQYCFSQISSFLDMAEAGAVSSEDVLLFDDFMTLGIEAVAYSLGLMGIKPKMYAFLHAQSVDEYDFTCQLLPWIRTFERGIGEILDGIFVCCHTLKELVVTGGNNESGIKLGGIAKPNKVFVTGHPFCSEEVMERMPEWHRVMMGEERLGKLIDISSYKPYPNRKDQVVYSSRWDEEKQPWFFLDVAERVIKAKERAKFIVCTSSPKLRSNNKTLLDLLEQFRLKYPSNIILRENLSKEEYYAILCESKIQFNCAKQDFVAISLLEASVAGCYPIYPLFRSFPETLRYNTEYMYKPWNADQAANMVLDVLSKDDLWTYDQISQRSWIHSRFDSSWQRMLSIMGLYEGKDFETDPFG